MLATLMYDPATEREKTVDLYADSKLRPSSNDFYMIRKLTALYAIEFDFIDRTLDSVSQVPKKVKQGIDLITIILGQKQQLTQRA